MRVNNGINIGAGVVDGGMNHSLAGRLFKLGYRSFVTCCGVVLLAHFDVFIDIDQDNVLGLDLTKRCQHRFNEKLPGAGNARAHVTVIVSEALVKHDSIAQGDFILEFF